MRFAHTSAPPPSKWRKPLAASTALAVTATLFAGGVAQAETVAPLELSIVADGTAPFDADDAPGNDSSATNGIVRTHDTVQYKWSWQATNLQPALFTQTLPEGMEWTEQAKSSCINKDIALSEDKRTLDCELVPKVFGGNSYELIAKVKGIANNTELTTKFEGSGLTSNEVTVRTSAAPKWNISTLLSHPYPSYQGSDFGVTLQNLSYIWASVDPQKGIRGIEPLEEYSFQVAPNLGEHTTSPYCAANEHSFKQGSTVSCDQPVPGGPITITVTGATASTSLQDPLIPPFGKVPSIAIADQVNHYLFTPLTDYEKNRLVNKSTFVSDFDPESVSGQSNFGEGFALNQEPGAPLSQRTTNSYSTDMDQLAQGINSVALIPISADYDPSVLSPVVTQLPWGPNAEGEAPQEITTLGPQQWAEPMTDTNVNPDQKFSAMSYLTNKTYNGRTMTDVSACYRFDPTFIRPDVLGTAPFSFMTPVRSFQNPDFSTGTVEADPDSTAPPKGTLDLQNITVEYGTTPYPGSASNCGKDTGWHPSIEAAGGAHKVSTIRVKFPEQLKPTQSLQAVLPFIRVRHVDPGTESKIHVDYSYLLDGKPDGGNDVRNGRPLRAVGVALTPEITTADAASAIGAENVWQAKVTPSTHNGSVPDLEYTATLPPCVQYVEGSSSIPGVQVTPADHGPDGQPCTSDDISGQTLTVSLGRTKVTELPQFTFRTVTLSGEAATPGAPLTGKVTVSSTADPRDEELRTVEGGSTVSAQSAAPDSDSDRVSDERENWFGSNPNQANTWPFTQRVAGQDRYETAVAVSQRSAHTGDTVLIARGDTYPDALAGGPAAAKERGVLLLTGSRVLPEMVRDELRRIRPGKIIVLGGKGAVSTQVERSLRAYSNNVSRISGTNRYETAANIARTIFGTSDTAMLATGRAFPDALALGAAASIGEPAPVLLTDTRGLSGVTRNALTSLGSNKVIIGGGTKAVSKQVADTLTGMSLTVTRYSGTDRYQTSARIAEAYTQAGIPAMYSTGEDFPDALVASNLARKYATPLLLSRPSCRPVSTTAVASGLGAYYRYLIGGTRVLKDNVPTTTCQ